jgi:hypothetical protein
MTALAIALACGLLSLVRVLLLVRRVAVPPSATCRCGCACRRDELSRLAHSLNATVEELAADQQRQAAQAGDRAYRAAQDAFSDAMQAAETERRRTAC